MTASSRYIGDEGIAYNKIYGGLYPVQAEATFSALRPFLRETDRVLDFGCAEGSLLARLPNDSKVGIEVNADSRAAAESRNLEIHESLEALDDDSVDLAVSSHVLEHTLNPLQELEGLRRVISERGRLVLVLPLDDWRAQRSWTIPDVNHHLYTWTPQLLANLLSEAGFAPRQIEVWTYTMPGRFTVGLHSRLPPRLFDLVARGTAILRRRRQVVAMATPV